MPKKKGAFENAPLSRSTGTRRVENIGGNLELQPSDTIQSLHQQKLYLASKTKHPLLIFWTSDIQQLKNSAANFDFFSLALEESCDAHDTAQLLIFSHGITEHFQITEELGAMQSMKGTTTGRDFFTEVNACLDNLGLKWHKLTGVIMDSCPNLKGKMFDF